MPKIEKAITIVNRAGIGYSASSISAPVMLIVTIIYLVATLSVPLTAPQRLIWLAVYPVITSEMLGIGFGKLFLSSLWVLPVVILIAVFNPILDTTTVLHIGGIAISKGWVTFTSIILRGLLSMQGVLILIRSTGFYEMCNSMRSIGLPSVLTTQLLLSYRYIGVMIEEAVTMKRAREARGFGRKSYPLKMWGVFVGQLLIRSIERAGRIHRAMKARGFDGSLPMKPTEGSNRKSYIFLAVWTVIIIMLRVI